jgi:uncharacterized protein YutD
MERDSEWGARGKEKECTLVYTIIKFCWQFCRFECPYFFILKVVCGKFD